LTGALLSLVRSHREAIAPAAVRDDEEARVFEESLGDFVEAAWPSIDASEYQGNWAIDGLCEHLQAVTSGQIKRLLVNFPPRCGKTLITSVCFPAWTWARREQSYLSGPGVRFLCGSYGHTLSLINSNLTRRLILSPWYQSFWGCQFALRPDQNTKIQFDNDAGGSRLATSVGGSLLGLGGDAVIVDDPHNTESVESEAERESVLRWWSELSTTRLNNPREAAIVVIMQRLHEEDVSGKILSGGDEWVHFCVPMSYEPARHCVTVLGWQDPRKEEGELLWPERFGAQQVAAIKAGLGPYMASGRLQQMPVPDKGGIFERSWWQLWDEPTFPRGQYIVASVDGAFTEKEENDPSAMTVWATFRHEKHGYGILLIDAWRKHLKFSGDRSLIEPRPSGSRLVRASDRVFEDPAWVTWRRRNQQHWGLVEWIEDTCNRRNVDVLLIEGKASGISAAQELQNRYGHQQWSPMLCPVKGDKVARALAAQPTFAQGLVYAPDREWAEMVINEMAVFPKGKYDDCTDSATQAINHLRAHGLARTKDERDRDEVKRVVHRPRPQPLYPV
jgi:predicted phage terminase large subunit-like protein